MTTTDHDVIVIGGGAAGLSAAQMLGRARRDTLVLDDALPRNRFAAHLHGVLGHDGQPPAALLATGRGEAERYGVRIRSAAGLTAATVTDLGDALQVRLTDGDELTARALVVASGVRDVLPDVPGLAERWGRTVLHCPYCHGHEVAGRPLGVLLGAFGTHQAEMVRQWSDEVTLLLDGTAPPPDDALARLRARGVRVVDAPVRGMVDGAADGVRVELDGGEQLELAAVFAAPALRPRDEFLGGLGLTRRDLPVGSFLAVDAQQRTSHPRILAAGNVCDPMGSIPIAMGAGTMAGAAANGLLVAEDGDRALAVAA